MLTNRRLHGVIHACAWRRPSRRALLASVAVFAAWGTCDAAPLPDAAVAGDSRLSQKMTVVAERVYLGDLIPALSRIAKVPLALEDRNREGDPRLTLYVREARIFDVLNGIWSALSYRGAEWHWSVEGKRDSIRYRLSRSMRAAQFGTTIKDWVSREFAHQAEAYLAAAALDPESRKSLLTQQAASLYPAEQRDQMLATAISGQRKWDGLALFLRTYIPDERARILSGQSSGRISLTDLGEDAVTFARSIWEREAVTVSENGGPQVRRAMPTHIEFSAEAQGPTGIPCLMIWMHREDGKSGYAYLGGMPIAVKLDRMLSDLWSLDGDSHEGPAGERQIRGDTKGRERVSEPPSLQNRVRRLARMAPVNVAAVLPLSVSVDIPDPLGYRLEEYLALLKDQAGIMCKSRNGVLVLAAQSWYRDGTAEVPWRVVKRLREMQTTERDGVVGFDGLVWMVRELTPAQLATFASEYSGAAAALALRDLLLIEGATPGFVRALTAPGGVRLTPEQSRTLRRSWAVVSSLPDTELAVRITGQKPATGANRARRLKVSVRSGDRPWVRVLDLGYGPLGLPNVEERAP